MYNFKYLQILSLSLFSCVALASNVDSGEWDFDHYDGPLDPRLVIDHQSKKQQFLDDYFGIDYFDTMLSPDLVELTKEFNNYIYPSFSCSKFELENELPYMRYLIRLTSIASLYEFYRESSIALYQLGNDSSCKLNYDVVFKQCKPQSKDMKLFVNRVSDYFPDIVDWGKYPIKLKTDRRFSIANYHPTLVKILNSNFSGSSEKSIIAACQYVRSEILSLCSENDKYMAASGIREIKNEILKASAFKIINKNGKGEACFNRYYDESKELEKIDSKSSTIIKAALKSDDDLKVFWFGSLREFDEKGVTLIEQKAEPVQTVAKVEKKVEAPVKTVDIKSIKIIRRPKIEPVKKPEPKKVVVLSAFEKAIGEYQKSKQNSLVDMDEFKRGYKFSKKTLEKFNGNLRSYQTRKQLAKMKRVDDVGSPEAPMSLTFIKYLIDYNLHQGLYNMTGILGKEFYVINDLEGKSYPVQIILDNNKETKFKWKIWVTKY